MRYSKILMAIVLISMLVFGNTMSAFAVDGLYQVTFTVREGMGTVPDDGDYLSGTEVPVTAIPDEGYQFVKWIMTCVNDSKESADPSFTFLMHQHAVSLEAVFELVGTEPRYHLDIKANDTSMGTVSSSGNYKYEEAVPVLATPYEGYQFIKWDSSCSGEEDFYEPSLTYSMHEHNITLTAYFEEKTYRIITSVDGDDNQDTKGSVTEGGTYRYTEDVNIVATPKDGYKFVKWMADFGDGNFVPPGFEDPIIQCNLSHCGNGYFAEIELRAYFELIEQPTTAPTTEAPTQPTTAPTTEAPTEPTTAPTTEAPTEPTTAPTTEAPTDPTTAPTTDIPTTEPTTAPTTGIPTTEPTTAPTTEAPTEPTTAPTTAAPTEPTTVATTEDDDEVITITFIPTTSPATTETEATEVVTEEGVPLGAPGIVNFDEFFEEMDINFDEFVEEETGTDVMVDDGEEILDGEVPLAEGLPQTGQVSADMFYGIGGLISGLGLWLKRKK